MSDILNNQKNQESQSDNLFHISDNKVSVNNGTNENNQKQKETKYQYEVAEHLKQQAQKEIQRRIQIVKEVHSYIDAENRFKKEQFFDRRFIYLISMNWIQKWKKYTQFELISNKKMLSLKNSYDLSTLPKMNQNIVDVSFKASIKIEKYQEIDVCIKQNLREEVDFIYANEQMFRLFDSYQSIPIKREVVQYNREKIIDLYPLKVTLVMITSKMLTEIKTKKRTQPITQTLLFSKSGSLAIFQLYVFDHIVNALNFKHILDHKEISTSQSNIKYYYLNPSFQRERLVKRIQLSLQYQLLAKEHSICLPIQPFDSKSPIGEVVGCNEPIIICEIHQKSEPKQMRILYNEKIFPFMKCPSCKTECELKHQCKCRCIAYCCENCENSDIEHRKKCNSKIKQSAKKTIEQNKNKNGLVGLTNLGNTCFMNSGLQCLSHIRQLTEYFLSDSYIKDINTTSNLGTKGILAKSYCTLLKNLWQQSKFTFSPHEFKKVLGGFQRNYLGYSQQDSGELITHILDALHEDLNKIKSKPYFQSKEIDQRPEQVIADEQWQQFLKRNNSKIVELMYGQFRSEVSCPNCKYKSVQFDPFSMCSIPIAQVLSVNVVFQDDDNLQQEVLTIPYQDKDKLSKVIEHTRLIKNINEELKLIVYTSKTELNLDADIVDVKLKFKGNLTVRVLSPQYQSLTDSCRINVTFKTQKSSIFGQSQPCFKKMFKFKNNLSLVQIHQILYEQIRKLIDLGDYHKMVLAQSKQESKICLYNQRNQMEICWKCNTKCRPLQCYFPYSQKKISQILKGKNNFSITYIIKSRLHRQYKNQNKGKGGGGAGIKLLDCFTAFEDPEILTKDNAWKCPKCWIKVTAKKRMMLYKLPQILIICLKRFKKKVYGSQKNHSPVSFPLKGLDLTSKVISKSLPSISSQNNTSSPENNKGVIYDLFGVSYHYGDAGSGHYTAACKNNDRNAWYKFDDESVSPISEDSVSNPNAYILFYRRR